MKRPPAAAVLFLAAMACSCVAGCGDKGPELGRVEGTVTLDGSPLAGARVEFQPQQGGSPSYGSTDEAGHYELIYSVDRPGALLGSHEVRITTFREESDGTGPPTVIPEKAPPRYNSETELTREVKPGDNPLDFPLESAE